MTTHNRKSIFRRVSHRCVIRHTQGCVKPASPYTECAMITSKENIKKKKTLHTHTLPYGWWVDTRDHICRCHHSADRSWPHPERRGQCHWDYRRKKKKIHVKVRVAELYAPQGIYILNLKHWGHWRVVRLNRMASFYDAAPDSPANLTLHNNYNRASLLEFNDAIHCCLWFGPAPLYFSGQIMYYCY